MERGKDASFDPETVGLLKEALDGAWSRLSPHQQALTSRSVLAKRILRAAADGERDPVRLQTRALFSISIEGPRLS